MSYVSIECVHSILLVFFVLSITVFSLVVKLGFTLFLVSLIALMFQFCFFFFSFLYFVFMILVHDTLSLLILVSLYIPIILV